MSEDADVSRPVRNLHGFTGDGRAAEQVPPFQSLLVSTAAAFPWNAGGGSSSTTAVHSPPLTALGLRVVQKVQFTAH